MKNTYVILNESHSLMEEQREILSKAFNSFEVVAVPKEGWTLQEMEQQIQKLEGNNVVFASPVPYMVAKLSYLSGYGTEENCINANAPLVGLGTKVFVFHNDKRVKKELSNGKIVHAIAPTGWQLVEIK